MFWDLWFVIFESNKNFYNTNYLTEGNISINVLIYNNWQNVKINLNIAVEGKYISETFWISSYNRIVTLTLFKVLVMDRGVL